MSREKMSTRRCAAAGMCERSPEGCLALEDAGGGGGGVDVAASGGPRGGPPSGGPEEGGPPRGGGPAPIGGGPAAGGAAMPCLVGPPPYGDGALWPCGAYWVGGCPRACGPPPGPLCAGGAGAGA